MVETLRIAKNDAQHETEMQRMWNWCKAEFDVLAYQMKPSDNLMDVYSHIIFTILISPICHWWNFYSCDFILLLQIKRQPFLQRIAGVERMQK